MENTVGKVIKCRAAVAWEKDKPLSIEEIEVDPPKAHEVRVRMISTGICHSDASALHDILKISNKFPLILGHEGAGIVESIGEGVTKFKPGDHVIPLYVPHCFECPSCKNPKTNLCDLMGKMQTNCCMIDGTSRFRCKGKILYQFVGTATFSEYTVVADACLAKINEKAPLEKVCLIGCAISTGYGAVLNAAKVEAGSTCAVWGLGGIGMAAIMGCRNAGASKIYGIDINPDKFELAKKFGCTEFINPKDFPGRKIQDVLMEMTDGGFDYTFECIGNVDAMRSAFESSNRIWGVNVLIGLAQHDKVLNIFPRDIIKGRTLKGTYFGGWNGVEDIPKLVEDYMNKKILVDEFITHTMKLDQINDAFDLMKDGKSIRSVVIF